MPSDRAILRKPFRYGELAGILARLLPVDRFGTPLKQFAKDPTDTSLDHLSEERVAVVIELADSTQLVQAMRVLEPRGYSCRSASIGSRRAARRAGK